MHVMKYLALIREQAVDAELRQGKKKLEAN